MIKLLLILSSIFFIGCSVLNKKPESSPVIIVPTPSPTPVARIALSWESGHDERAIWSDVLTSEIGDQLLVFESAKDVQKFCPKFVAASDSHRVQAIAEIFVEDSRYESGWKPASNSQDVGTSDKNTWSVGLLQVSVDDAANKSLGFNFSDLQNPLKNIKLGVAIMVAQIKSKGVILIPKGQPGVYWSTLHPGGTYDKSAQIEAHVKSLSFCQ